MFSNDTFFVSYVNDFLSKTGKKNMIVYNTFMSLKSKQKATDEFGKRLRKIRKAVGLTQYQFADMTKTSQRMIAHYETQKTRPPMDKLVVFAQTLNVSVEELIGSEELPQTLKEKEDVSYKIMKKVRVIEKLPVRDQKAIFRLINSLAEKNKIQEG